MKLALMNPVVSEMFENVDGPLTTDYRDLPILYAY